MPWRVGSLVLAVLLLYPAVAKADATAVSFLVYRGTDNQSVNIGWSFRVDTPIDVSSLGYFDVDSDGLASAHTVGIFRFGDTSPLVSAVVGAGTSSELRDGFRYTSIVPYHLSTGHYFLMANNPATDPFVGSVLYFQVDPRITYGTGVYSIGGDTLQIPTATSTIYDPSLFGPNFEIVPEAPTLLLMSAGLMTLAVRSSLWRRSVN